MSKQLTTYQKAAQFRNRSNMGRMLLYIGTKADPEELRLLAQQKWACIFTCRDDVGLQEIFLKAGVKTQLLSDELPINPLELLRSKNQDLPIVPMKREKASGKRSVDPKALRAMAALVGDGFNTLMVVGYDHDPDDYGDDLDLPERFLEEQEAKSSSVVFWGIRNEAMRQVLTELKVDWNEEPLSAIVLEDEDEDEEDYVPVPSAGKYFFFANGRPVTAPRGTAYTPETQKGVLTQAQLDVVSPLGASDFQKWFNNFLERSSNPKDGPQWYAYTNRCNFSVKRDCEDALVALTRNALEGHWPGKKEADCYRRILVEGHSGSGKSVLLGALAYRIFQEKRHPVLFIQSGARPSEISDLLDSVKGACGEDYPRILIVWDCSAYLPGAQSEIQEMQKKLEDRYHRFVLVCSSYSVTPEDDDQVFYAYNQNGEFQPQEQGLMRKTGEKNGHPVTYYIPVSRTLSETECNSLWNKFRTHSAMDNAQLKIWQQRLEGDTDLFQICYKMINLLRSNLQEGLRKEHTKVSTHVNTILSSTLNKLLESKKNSAFAAAFRAAGKPDGFSDKSYDASDVELLLQKVDIRIAMFSRFDKMEVPYSYIRRLLTQGLKSETVTDSSQPQRKGKLRIQRNLDSYGENLVYSDDAGEQDLFELITTQIPWLRCGENEDGEFTCSFRNALEAEIFLEHYQVDPAQQVDILIEMLEYYLETLQTGQGISPLFVNNLGKLLRNMGPNSKHPEFTAKGSTKSFEYDEIQRYIYDVVDVLQEICSYSQAVNPHYVCDYITFVREGYTPKNGESELSPEGLEKFQAVIELADRKIKAMNDAAAAQRRMSDREVMQKRGIRNYNNGLLDTLRNEKALCQSILCNHWATYHRSGYEGPKPEGLWEWPPSVLVREYTDIFNNIKQILNTGTTKGLYYNTLFKAFLDLYEFFPEEDRVTYANQLRDYVDTCLLLDQNIEHDSRGREMMKKNIQLINEKDSRSQYTVDTLLQTDAGDETALPENLRLAYRRTLENKDPSVLILAASRRLRANNCFASDLGESNKPIAACKQVYELLSAHADCLSGNAYGLWLLIYTMWISINKQSLFSREEPRTVELSMRQWRTLYGYCKSYCESEKLQSKSEVCLLYALSAYYTRSFQDCDSLLKSYSYPLENNGSERKRHPYRLCLCSEETPKTRVLLTGRFSADGNMVQELELDGWRFSARLNGKTQHNQLPSNGSAVQVEIGLGYAGLTAYLSEVK